jgi:phage terminase large subunit-like protein
MRLTLAEQWAARARLRANPPELKAIKAWYESDCGTGTCRSCAACRPEQRTPSGEWDTWLYLAGRGAGKTRSAAEDSGAFGVRNPGTRQAVVAPTFADARDTCVEGESGLLAVFDRYGWEEGREYQWNRSLGEIKAVNGSRWKLFSAEKPARLRGPQHHRAWAEETAQIAITASDAWDMLRLGLRLGAHPRVVATTTPLPIALIKTLLANKRTVVTRGSTYDNAANLSESALRFYTEAYEGTRLGRQELMGELLDDLPGALWQREWIERHRLRELPDTWRTPAGMHVPFSLVRVVVAVDPAVTSGEDADETGIIVVGLGNDGRLYVLADLSLRATPSLWAGAILDAYDEWDANDVVIEVNNGGDALTDLIREVEKARGRGGRPAPIRTVRAKKGKRVRAEPASALYEQGRVSHVGTFPATEDQVCTWLPEKVESPDRMDALVYALLYLSMTGGPATIARPSGATLQRHQAASSGLQIQNSVMSMGRR